MSATLYVDTAGNAPWNWRKDADKHKQPHLVRICAELWDDDSDHALDGMAEMLRPPVDEPMTGAAAAIHGFTQEDIDQHVVRNVPAGLVFGKFQDVLSRADRIASHSMAYHRKMLLRWAGDLGMELILPDAFCTMTNSADIVQIKLQGNGRWQWPSLRDAYRHFVGREMADPKGDPLYSGRINVDAVHCVDRGIRAFNEGRRF